MYLFIAILSADLKNSVHNVYISCKILYLFKPRELFKGVGYGDKEECLRFRGVRDNPEIVSKIWADVHFSRKKFDRFYDYQKIHNSLVKKC